MQDHNESGDNSGPGGAQGMRGVSSQRVLAALAISALGAAAVNWAPAELVEDLYCKRLYPLIFHAQARLLEGLPFSVSEVGLVLLVLLLGLRAFLSVRKVVSQEVSFGALIIAALRRALWLCCVASYIAVSCCCGDSTTPDDPMPFTLVCRRAWNKRKPPTLSWSSPPSVWTWQPAATP